MEGSPSEQSMRAFVSGDADAFAALVDRYQGRIFACFVADTGDEAAAAALFADTFVGLARARDELDVDVDPDITVYRFALRARKRHTEAARADGTELSAILYGLDEADRTALSVFLSSGLKIGEAAEALRRPMERVQESVVRGLLAAARGELAAYEPSEIEDEHIALVAMRWVEPDERKAVEDDAAAKHRLQVIERAAAWLRELLPPKDPPTGLPEQVIAVAKTRIEAIPIPEPVPARTRAGVAALSVLGLLLLGGGAFAAMRFLGEAPVPEPVVDEETEAPAEAPPEREPPKSADDMPEIEFAAQGPPLPSNDARVKKATKLARRGKCKKAAKMFIPVLEASKAELPAITAGMRSCTRWMKKFKGDAHIEAFTRQVVGDGL